MNCDSNNVIALKKLAQCYHIQKNYTYALEYYEKVLAKTPDDTDTLINKAIVLHATDELDSAIQIYKEVLKKQEDKRVRENLLSAINTKGEQALEVGKVRDAILYFNEVLNYDVNNDYAYFGLGMAYEYAKNKTKAIENYEKAIEIDPNNKEYRTAYEKITGQQPTVQKVVKSQPTVQTQKQTTTAQPTKESLIKEGDALYKSQKYTEAINKYTQALKLDSNDYVTYLKLGNMYKAQKNATKSSEAYQNAIKINPKYTDAWFNLGLVYAETSNYSDCQKCFQKVIALDPTYLYAYYALAMAYESDKKYPEAIENYEKFLSLNKDAKAAQVVQNKLNVLKKNNQ